MTSWPDGSDSAAPPEAKNVARAIVVSADAAGFRRAVGPAAWIVFEELALAGRPNTPGTVVSELDLRRIAARLGLAKGTVARGIQQLHDCGVVSFEASRGAGGRFGRGRYTVKLEGTGVAPLSPAAPRVTPRDTEGRGTRVSDGLAPSTEHSTRSQLDLFEVPTTTSDSDTSNRDKHPNPARDRHSRVPDPTPMSTDALAPRVRTRVKPGRDESSPSC